MYDIRRICRVRLRGALITKSEVPTCVDLPARFVPRFFTAVPIILTAAGKTHTPLHYYRTTTGGYDNSTAASLTRALYLIDHFKLGYCQTRGLKNNDSKSPNTSCGMNTGIWGYMQGRSKDRPGLYQPS